MKKTETELLQAYQDIHDGKLGFKIDGVTGELKSKNLFDGSNFQTYVMPHFDEYMANRSSATVLDYGSGKATQLFLPNLPNNQTFHQRYPGKIQAYWCYDPGFKKYSRAPSPGTKFDVVICADVMEHIPEENVDEHLQKMSDYLEYNGIGLFSISGIPAKKLFLDDTNFHVNSKPLDWWVKKFEEVFPRRYVIVYTDVYKTVTYKKV